MRNKIAGTMAALAALAMTAGCYHATVETGRQPSAQVVENKWAHGFVYGLVPPATVKTASECSSGVARVETQQSFLNGLASVLTWGLYTPMTISVTCAAGGTASIATDAEIFALGENTTRDELTAALNAAATRSKQNGEAVYVTFGSAE